MVEIRILGPLEVVEDGRPVVVAAPKVRALLAVLLLHRGEVVSTDRLIDALWGERASPTAAKTVQVYVSNLRKALGDGLVVTEGHGYVLRAEPGQLDVDRFEALVAQGRGALEQGDALTAAAVLREALGVWRGPALADFAYEPFAQSEIARLEEGRLAALEDRIDADLALGEDARLVGELESLVREHPVRERLRGQLMLALYRSGRQADALQAYRDARRQLLDELGLEPGRALQELEQAILLHDPALDAPGRPAARSAPATAKRTVRGGVLIAAAGALLLAVIAAVAVKPGRLRSEDGSGGAQLGGGDRRSQRPRRESGVRWYASGTDRVRLGVAVDSESRRSDDLPRRPQHSADGAELRASRSARGSRGERRRRLGRRAECQSGPEQRVRQPDRPRLQRPGPPVHIGNVVPTVLAPSPPRATRFG